jgi:transporter family protein
MWTTNWFVWAVASAVFAAVTAIFAKVGAQGVASDLATLIRTVVVVGAVSAVVALTGNWVSPATLTTRTLVFLVLSGLATAASWLCYFRALQLGPVSVVAPIDKLSIVLVALFAVLFLGERPMPRDWLGIALIASGVVVIATRQ